MCIANFETGQRKNGGVTMKRAFLVTCILGLLLVQGSLPCQVKQSPSDLEKDLSLKDFYKWLEEWKQGIVPLRSSTGPDFKEISRMETIMEKLASLGDLDSAKALFKAATVRPTGMANRAVLMMEPWRVRRTARKYIASMKGDGIDEWLLSMRTAKTQGGKASPVKAALEILVLRRCQKAVNSIYTLARSGNLETRLAAVRALGRISDPKTVFPLLRKFLRERRPEIRCAALDAMGKAASPYTDETIPPHSRPGQIPGNLLKTVLEDMGGVLALDKAWQARAAAADALLALKTLKAVPYLIKGLDSELKRRGRRDWSRRVAKGIGRALKVLTGMNFSIDSAEPWKEWWEKSGKTGKIAYKGIGKSGKAEGTAGVYVRYFNIDVDSDRILFIVDASGSMARKVKLKGRYAGMEGETVKFDLVKRELKKVILALPSKAAVNVIFFNEEITPFRPMSPGNPGLMLMSDRNKEALLEFLALTSPRGLTNLYGALNLALHATEGRKSFGRGKRSYTDPVTFDTIYLLSDGAPTAGKVVDPERILELVDEANAVKKVVINTITFGDVNNAMFMEELARRNGGEHVHLE